jgi:hypothetical protein
LTTTSSAEGIPQLLERLPVLVEGGVRVDRHRDLDVAVANDVPDDMRRNGQIRART